MADKKIKRGEDGKFKSVKTEKKEEEKELQKVVFEASHNKLMLPHPLHDGRIEFDEGFYEAKEKEVIDFLMWKVDNPSVGTKINVVDKIYK
jgi:hypothetical protein